MKRLAIQSTNIEPAYGQAYDEDGNAYDCLRGFTVLVSLKDSPGREVIFAHPTHFDTYEKANAFLEKVERVGSIDESLWDCVMNRALYEHSERDLLEVERA